MPKLNELTDAYEPEEIPAVEPLPTDRPRVIINTAEFDKPKPDPLWDDVEGFKTTVKNAASGIADAIKYASELDQKFTSSVLNFPKKAYENSDDLVKGIKNLFGMGEGERYQLWPEKVVKEALTGAGDIAKPNPYPEGSEQWQFYESKRQEGMVPAAMAISALAGSGGLAGTGAKAGEVALGATPFLRPALKHKNRLYKGKPGQEHQDIIPKELYEDFSRKAMSGEDLAEYNFGFINDKGYFLDREKALKYGIDTGLIDPHSGRFGALTTTLMADSSKPGTAIEAVAKTQQPTFYSAVEHTINNIPQTKMTGEQWLGTIANKLGVKGEELDWTGLKGFLEENKGKPVTKAQIEEHLAQNKIELKEVNKGGEAGTKERAFELAKEHGWKSWDDIDATTQAKYMQRASREAGENPTKYHSYQLPGGENYREMLLTLPNKQQRFYEWEYFDPKTQTSKQFKTEAEAKAAAPEGAVVVPKEVAETNPAYKSSHWDEPNILAHVRMNDRNIDGKKSLHLEEIQSDWHQQGRDKGYKGQTKAPNTEGFTAKEITQFEQPYWQVLDKEGKHYFSVPRFKGETIEQAIAKAVERKPQIADSNAVPDAPFKKSWHELALKRMIREAAEKGYDRLSWTPGEAQAARYDLSKQVKKVHYDPDLQGGTLAAEGLEGRTVLDKQGIKPDQIADYVGKDVAKKLLETKRDSSGIHTLEGVDLKVGGEGMKGFYDQIIPKAVEKLTGQKVKKGEVETKNINKTVDDRYSVTGDARIFNTRKEAESAASSPIHYIDITPELKQKALQKGFPLFSNAHPGYTFIPYAGNPFENKQ